MVRNYKRKTERHSWTQENLQLAIQSVKSTSTASTRYEVPRTTIQYWLDKNPPIQPSLGRFRPVFLPDMENELGNHIIEVEKLFHGLNPSDVRRIAYEFAERNNISHPFNTSKKISGKYFLSGFMKRQGNLSLRKPEATSMTRVAGFTRHKVNVFFEILESLVKKHIFPAARIFNVDETGITTIQTPKRIIAEKGRKQVGRITSAERGKNITVVGTVTAGGTFIPPMIIFPRLRMNQLLMTGAFPGSVGFPNPSGSIDQELFLKYLDHFIDCVRPSVDRPALLILDGHNSHKSLAAIEKCRGNGVAMVTLPPHTSNRLQPLDISMYEPLKIYVAQEMDRWMTNLSGQRITDYDMAPILKTVYIKAFTPIVKRKLVKVENRKLKKLKVSKGTASAKSSTKSKAKSSILNNQEEDKDDKENDYFCIFCNGKYRETQEDLVNVHPATDVHTKNAQILNKNPRYLFATTVVK